MEALDPLRLPSARPLRRRRPLLPRLTPHLRLPRPRPLLLLPAAVEEEEGQLNGVSVVVIAGLDLLLASPLGLARIVIVRQILLLFWIQRHTYDCISLVLSVPLSWRAL